MKNGIKSLLLGSILGVCGLTAQTITGYGTGDFTFDEFSSAGISSNSQSATSYTATIAAFGGNLVGTLESAVILVPSPDFIEFTGTFSASTLASEVFVIDLYDAEGDFLSYNGSFAGFIGVENVFSLSKGLETITVDGYSGTVAFVGLHFTGVSGSATVNLNNLAAAAPIPEPSTYALGLGVIGLAVAVWRRRKAA